MQLFLVSNLRLIIKWLVCFHPLNSIETFITIKTPFGPTPSFSNLRDHGRSYPTDNIAVNFQLPFSKFPLCYFFFFVFVSREAPSSPPSTNGGSLVETWDDEANLVTNSRPRSTLIAYLLASQYFQSWSNLIKKAITMITSFVNSQLHGNCDSKYDQVNDLKAIRQIFSN